MENPKTGKEYIAYVDLDDNAHRWTEPHAEAMLASAETIQRITELPMKTIEESMMHSYGEAGTFDNKFLVQTMPALFEWSKAIEDERERYIRTLDLGFTVQSTYEHTFEKYFGLFPGIEEALKTLKENGVTVIALTDSPEYKAIRRMILSGSLPYFDHIYARPNPTIDDYPESVHYERERERAGVYDIGIPVTTLPKPKCETNLAELSGRSEDFIAHRAVVTGDSFESDIVTASRNGCPGILSTWKKIGLYHATILNRFGPPEVVHRNFSGIAPSDRNFDIIYQMHGRLFVVDQAREMAQCVLQLQQAA